MNYRANVDAMRRLGVRSILAPFAAGSLRPDAVAGHLVVVDQLVDRTSGRAETFHDHFADGPCHVSMADPYDATLRSDVLATADATRDGGADGGTVVVVNGPRFSTRAESSWFRAMGADLVNMTQHPEAALAREAGIAYAGIALVTDYDAGVADDPAVAPVTQDEVFACFERNLARVRDARARDRRGGHRRRARRPSVDGRVRRTLSRGRKARDGPHQGERPPHRRGRVEGVDGRVAGRVAQPGHTGERERDHEPGAEQAGDHRRPRCGRGSVREATHDARQHRGHEQRVVDDQQARRPARGGERRVGTRAVEQLQRSVEHERRADGDPDPQAASR